jgi:hypothetical protein
MKKIAVKRQGTYRPLNPVSSRVRRTPAVKTAWYRQGKYQLWVSIGVAVGTAIATAVSILMGR